MATVVSAYFRIPSKHPQQNYFSWIKNFLEHIPCNLVFFTEQELIPLFTSWRGEYMDRTVFIPFKLDDAEAYKKYGHTFWEAELEKDTEYHWQSEIIRIHNPRLYAIWYEKKEFVLKAIALNPFNHEKFLWCDAGGFRITSWFEELHNFPNPDKISNSKFFFYNIEPFTEVELQNPLSDFSKVTKIAAGYLGGTADIWKQYSRNYDITLQEYIKHGMFVGKEQTVMAGMYVANPNFFELLPANKKCEDMWFYPQLYFS